MALAPVYAPRIAPGGSILLTRVRDPLGGVRIGAHEEEERDVLSEIELGRGGPRLLPRKEAEEAEEEVARSHGQRRVLGPAECTEGLL